jgi:hypothetical protein
MDFETTYRLMKQEVDPVETKSPGYTDLSSHKAISLVFCKYVFAKMELNPQGLLTDS